MTINTEIKVEKFDTVIVGAGIAGITTAYYLNKERQKAFKPILSCLKIAGPLLVTFIKTIKNNIIGAVAANKIIAKKFSIIFFIYRLYRFVFKELNVSIGRP